MGLKQALRHAEIFERDQKRHQLLHRRGKIGEALLRIPLWGNPAVQRELSQADADIQILLVTAWFARQRQRSWSQGGREINGVVAASRRLASDTAAMEKAGLAFALQGDRQAIDQKSPFLRRKKRIQPIKGTSHAVI